MYKSASDESKAETRRGDWTWQALAQRWGRSERWTSNVLGNEGRRQHWDDALAGLSVLKRTKNK